MDASGTNLCTTEKRAAENCLQMLMYERLQFDYLDLFLWIDVMKQVRKPTSISQFEFCKSDYLLEAKNRRG